MEEDARRKAANAAAACLQPNFVPKTSKITSAQLSKFQELHKRRLQIKSRSKIEKKIKGNGKPREKDVKVDRVTSAPDQENSSVASSNGSSSLKESPSVHSVSTQKRKKLHWGLDTKERWEMKANM